MNNDVSGVYRHYKGGTYLVFGESTSTVDKSKVIFYKDIFETDLNMWHRPSEEFFGMVEVEDEMIPRFQKLTDMELEELVNMMQHPCQCGEECQCGGTCK